MKKLIFFLLIVFQSLIAIAATVDTIQVYSVKMKRSIPCVIIRPDTYTNPGTAFPVVYLLHGYSGDYSNWIKKVPALKQAVDNYQLIIVCPDGAYSSWYLDSPVDSSMQYETFTSAELPLYIDQHYHTMPDRQARAIAGLSMGGHGALMLAFRHPEIFGACGSMSGAVDLQHVHNKFDLIKRLGDSVQYNTYWKQYSVLGIAAHYPQPDSLAIIIDCGVDDFFAEDNRKLHEALLARRIAHDYIERPGSHNWDYWTNAVQYQLLFFKNYFEKRKR